MAIEKTLRGVVLASVFALPFIVFIVAQSLFFPFITGKNFAFRILVEIATGAWLALALANPAYRPKRGWLLGAFAVFVAVVALADALGAYPFKSIWSNFERMDGLVTLVHLFFYFVVASSILTTEKLWRAFWHTSLGVSVLMALHGLLQLAGFAELNPGFSSAARIDATFGNPIYLAVYMLFHVGIAAMLWARARESGRMFTGASALYGSVIALDGLAIFLTGTRGTMLGLIAGVALAALLIAFASSEGRKKALTVVVGLLVLASAFFLVREQAWVQKIPFLQRLATISLEDNTTKARFMNWGMAWEGVKERPILGWGQENYAVVFDKHYNPEMYGQEQWFDRVHNVVFDWLIAAGFLGLFSYLSLFFFALLALYQKGVFGVYERSILTGLLAAYFFHNLFVFDNIGSYLLFASVLAYIAWRGGAAAVALPMPNLSQKFLPVLAIGAVILVWGSAWYVNAGALAANRDLLNALKAQPTVNENLEYFKSAIARGSMGTQEAREQLAQIAAQMVRSENIPLEVRQAFAQTAVQELSLMTIEAPQNARPMLFLGVLLRSFGELEGAEVALERAHELSPNKQTILFELASVREAAGDVAGALRTYKQAYELAPEFLDARILYASALIRAGQDALAEELLGEVADSGAADMRIAAAYVTRNRYDKIISIWSAHVQANPTDAPAYFTLAAAYYKAGERARAIAALEGLAATMPEMKEQTDPLIEQIRSGTLEVN